ncbi:hypothetical protein D6817_03400 [Candidatus Pacearchaeota archaeon]|nr:MAG: hypothetical protein D6817_03400 [Candidatus Pacearchaeota archaeon]
MRKLRILVVCKHPSNSPEASACRLISSKGVKVVYSWKNTLKPERLKGVDVIVAIGGDGTVLSASHYVTRQLLLAVNSSPSSSVGHLTTITLEKLDKKIEQIKRGNFKIEELQRIEVSINGKKLKPLALNEVFMGSAKPYLISRYRVIVRTPSRTFEERQRSSGLIVSTGTGSTAWFKSAGGKPFSPQAPYARFVVREPYLSRLDKLKLRAKEIRKHDALYIIPEVPFTLAIDSIREFSVKPNAKIKLSLARFPLRRIV